MKKLTEQLKRQEGKEPVPYQDSKGHWTVAYGHLMSNPLSDRAMEMILKDDIGVAIKDFARLPLAFRRNLNEARRRVAINMLFNMGLGDNDDGFLSFKKMIQAVKDDDFETAGSEMLDSQWARNHKRRASKLTKIMKTGKQE